MTEGAVSGDDETAIKHLSYARACGSTFILHVRKVSIRKARYIIARIVTRSTSDTSFKRIALGPAIPRRSESYLTIVDS